MNHSKIIIQIGKIIFVISSLLVLSACSKNDKKVPIKKVADRINGKPPSSKPTKEKQAQILAGSQTHLSLAMINFTQTLLNIIEHPDHPPYPNCINNHLIINSDTETYNKIDLNCKIQGTRGIGVTGILKVKLLPNNKKEISTLESLILTNLGKNGVHNLTVEIFSSPIEFNPQTKELKFNMDIEVLPVRVARSKHKWKFDIAGLLNSQTQTNEYPFNLISLTKFSAIYELSSTDDASLDYSRWELNSEGPIDFNSCGRPKKKDFYIDFSSSLLDQVVTSSISANEQSLTLKDNFNLKWETCSKFDFPFVMDMNYSIIKINKLMNDYLTGKNKSDIKTSF